MLCFLTHSGFGSCFRLPFPLAGRPLTPASYSDQQAAEKAPDHVIPIPQPRERYLLSCLFHRIKQMLGYAASRVIQPLCHSEKRSDGESAFVVKTKEQADSSLSLGMTGRRTFTNIGGPKAHGTLGMKGTLFSSLPVHRGFSRLCCSLVPKSLMGWHLFKILDRVEALGIYFRRKTA